MYWIFYNVRTNHAQIEHHEILSNVISSDQLISSKNFSAFYCLFIVSHPGAVNTCPMFKFLTTLLLYTLKLYYSFFSNFNLLFSIV